jgi:diadenosine tetraphosphate (Ap4A) HIT family hydrolase
MHKRAAFDPDSYLERVRQGCFICKMLAGDPQSQHHIFYEDAHSVAFLNKYPTLYGYSLVCPKAHLTEVTGDFLLEGYLRLQSVVYRVAEALRQELGAERVYILSLGSQQGNSHVHWHVAPLPPGVPYEKQQFHALMAENGILQIPDEEMKDLASRLRKRL